MFQKQILEIPLLDPGKFGIFLVLALFPLCPTSLKATFPNRSWWGYPFKKFYLIT